MALFALQNKISSGFYVTRVRAPENVCERSDDTEPIRDPSRSRSPIHDNVYSAPAATAPHSSSVKLDRS